MQSDGAQGIICICNTYHFSLDVFPLCHSYWHTIQSIYVLFLPSTSMHKTHPLTLAISIFDAKEWNKIFFKMAALKLHRHCYQSQIKEINSLKVS